MQNRETPTSTTYVFDVLDEEGRAVREIPMTGPATIGRGSPAFIPDVVIPPECHSTSRQHATIDVQGHRVVLADTSKFGTIVNGTVINRGSVELHNGDAIVFGLSGDGWRIRFRISGSFPDITRQLDPLESLTVRDSPRQILVGRLEVEEHLGDRAFRLLTFLADKRGKWYPLQHLQELLWPDADASPVQEDQALSRFKKLINDLLRPHLKGQDAIESWPHRGYRMKPRLDDNRSTPAVRG